MNVVNARKIALVTGVLVAFASPVVAKDYKLEVEVTRPALIRLEGVHKLGIASDASSCNGEIANRLSARLFETGAFDMMERSQLEKIMKEHDINLAGLTDPTKAKETGKLLPVDAIVYASVDQCSVTDAKGTLKLKKKDASGPCVQVDAPALARTGTLNVTFKVVNVETGTQMTVRDFRRTLVRSYVEDPYTSNADCYSLFESNPKSGNSSFMTEDQMREALIDSATISFARTIAPHKEKVVLVWEDLVGDEISKQVMTYLNAELFDEAVEALDKSRTAIEADTQLKPDDKMKKQTAAYYDSGLLSEMKGDLGVAKDWYKKAFDVNPAKPDKKIVESMKRVNSLIKEQNTLQAQEAGN